MKNILCITSHDLNAPDYGPVLRCRNIFRMLSRFGRVNTVLASRYEEVLTNAKSPQADFELVHKIHLYPIQRRPLFDRLYRKFRNKPLNIEQYRASQPDCKHLKRLMAQYDLIWVHGLETADSFDLWHWPKTVLDVDDIQSSFYRRRIAEPDTKASKYWDNRKMKLWRRLEQRLPERFEAICVCSENDKRELGGAENIFVLQNGFNAPQSAPLRHPVNPVQTGFVGTFIYGPNRDGVRWFIDHIWPAIQEKIPTARLRLAGDKSRNFFSSCNVDTLGWVEDMETEMANWSLAIVPVRVGGGTRIKILEAFSRKCPVVSTSLGAYGHDVEDGLELLIADSPQDFVKSCLRILEDPAEGKRLAENAWKKFLQNGTWDSQAGHVAEVVQKIWGNVIKVKSYNTAFDVQINSNVVSPSATDQNANAAIAEANGPRPQVSAVIPAFNRANCVAKAVESALAQTFKHFEIIAVDDGSTDNTVEILEKFGDKIRIVRQKNRGVSAARNTGIRAARGKWIAFLDSDDLWHPEKLERQLKALEKYSAKICFTRSVNYQNEPFRDIEFISATLCEPEIYHVQSAVDSVCLSPRHPLIPTMVAEKELLEKAGLFDESFSAAEDAELLFRLSFLSGFIYLDRPLATISENSSNSLTYSEALGPMARRNQSYLRLQGQMYWRLVEVSPEKISVIRKRLGYFLARRAEIACAAGELPVARTLAWDGIFYAGSIRDFVRCAGILLLPNLVRTRAQKKWAA